MKQYRGLKVGTSKMKSGKPCVTVEIQGAGAFIAYEDPEELVRMAKVFTQAAIALRRAQGAPTLFLPGIPAVRVTMN